MTDDHWIFVNGKEGFSCQENFGRISLFRRSALFSERSARFPIRQDIYERSETEFNGVLVQDLQAYSGVSALMKNEERESLDFAVGVNIDRSCVGVTYWVNFSAVRLSENGGMELFVPLYDRPTAEGGIASNEFVLFFRRDRNAA